jgi:Na+/proline symporter
VLIISLFGSKMQEMHPDVLSISDFAGKRFGPVLRSMVVLIALFNMSIALLAEYTTIGTLFRVSDLAACTVVHHVHRWPQAPCAL